MTAVGTDLQVALTDAAAHLYVWVLRVRSQGGPDCRRESEVT